MAVKKDSGMAKKSTSKNIRTGRSSLVHKYNGDVVEIVVVHLLEGGSVKVARNASTKEILVSEGSFVPWSNVIRSI